MIFIYISDYHSTAGYHLESGIFEALMVSSFIFIIFLFSKTKTEERDTETSTCWLKLTWRPVIVSSGMTNGWLNN